MNVTGILSTQNVYKYNKINDGSVTTASVNPSTDTVEISAEALKQAKISAFLNDKPYSSYKYDWMIRNQPNKADEYIDNLINNYDEMSRPQLMPPLWSKDKDNYAKDMLGYKTANDVKKGMELGNFNITVHEMMRYLRGLDETEQTLKSDDKNWYIGSTKPFDTAGKALNGYTEDFSYYRDIKIDPETAEISFLPNDSDRWLSKDEFEKKSPDYKAGMDYYHELNLAISTGQSTAIKYIENFIADLSEEDRQYIKDTNLLGSPAFRNSGVKGLDYFETSYDNIQGVQKRIRALDSDWMEQLKANTVVTIRKENGEIEKISAYESEERMRKLLGMASKPFSDTLLSPKQNEYGNALKEAIIVDNKIKN